MYRKSDFYNKYIQVFKTSMMELSVYDTTACDICLKTSEQLLKATDTNPENIKWCVQLTTCVPEVVNF